MKYLYTRAGCTGCAKRRAELKEQGIPFEERNGERILGTPGETDMVDVEAMAEYMFHDQVFPVEFDVD